MMKAELVHPFLFTKNMPILRLPYYSKEMNAHCFGTMLYDLVSDPQQLAPIQNEEIERSLIRALEQEMAANDAPLEQYERLGLTYFSS